MLGALEGVVAPPHPLHGAVGRFRDTLRRRHCQQFLAGHEQVHQRARGKQPVSIFGDAPVAHFDKPKFQFHHRKHMLHLGAHLRLRAVPGALDFIDPILIAVPLAGEIPLSGRLPVQHRRGLCS